MATIPSFFAFSFASVAKVTSYFHFKNVFTLGRALVC
jgi:hypothetical protein